MSTYDDEIEDAFKDLEEHFQGKIGHDQPVEPSDDFAASFTLPGSDQHTTPSPEVCGDCADSMITAMNLIMAVVTTDMVARKSTLAKMMGKSLSDEDLKHMARSCVNAGMANITKAISINQLSHDPKISPGRPFIEALMSELTKLLAEDDLDIADFKSKCPPDDP